MSARRPTDPREATIWDYQLRQRVPDFQDYFDAGVILSRETYDRLPALRDRPYGTGHPREAFDLFPAAEPGGPVLIFIHGGYWQFLSRDMFAFVAGPLVDAGVTVALLGYPLTPDVTMPVLAETVARGIAAVRKTAHETGADADRIHLAGHSAGGHLATLMATWDWTHGALAQAIRSVTAVSGIYHLGDIPTLPQNEVIGLQAADVEALSPIRRVRPGLPALALYVGALETDAFHDQQAAMASAWSQMGMAATAETVARRHHFDVVLELADPDSPMTRALANRVDAPGR